MHVPPIISERISDISYYIIILKELPVIKMLLFLDEIYLDVMRGQVRQ